MTSRSSILVLLAALMMLVGTSVADYDGGHSGEHHSGERPPHKRDSWQSLVKDMSEALQELSTQSDGIEQSLKNLCDRVDRELQLNNDANYNLYYLQKMLNEQRSVIDSLRSGLPVVPPTTDTGKVSGQQSTGVRNKGGAKSPRSNDDLHQVEQQHEQLVAALKKLKNH